MCYLYNLQLCQDDSEIFDNVKNLEVSLSDEIKMAIVYIAGYISRNDNQYETHFYYENYEIYTN